LLTNGRLIRTDSQPSWEPRNQGKRADVAVRRWQVEGSNPSRRRAGDASLSLAEQIEINLAEPYEDHRVLKLARRRIAGARKRQSTHLFERDRASPAFGHGRTHNLTSFTGLQVAFRVPIKYDDDRLGHGQFQAGFRSSAEDLPVRRSATTSYAIFWPSFSSRMPAR
jgi:hypothetical protein